MTVFTRVFADNFSPKDSKDSKDFTNFMDPPPVWLMRQAGRYLPEYQELRANYPDFMDFLLDEEAAAKVTLMPLMRFPELDAAIIFCDILVLLHALGAEVKFIEGVGPVLSPLPSLPPLDQALQRQREVLAPTLSAIVRVRRTLEASKAVIGFSASPWTLACYALSAENGLAGRDIEAAQRKLATRHPEATEYFRFSEDLIADWMVAQAESGADVLMMFDSWAGALNGDDALVDRLVIDPTARVIAKVRLSTDKPIIVFARNLNKVERLITKARPDGVSLGEDQDLLKISKLIPSRVVIQGNLHPRLLLEHPSGEQPKEKGSDVNNSGGGSAMERETRRLVTSMRGRRYIANLGHGIDRFTPIANVQRFIDCVKGKGPI